MLIAAAEAMVATLIAAAVIDAVAVWIAVVAVAPVVAPTPLVAGGPPKGNQNARKHGGFTAETMALKKEITALARVARETMDAIE
jgi:hypothetical protein